MDTRPEIAVPSAPAVFLDTPPWILEVATLNSSTHDAATG